MPDLSIQERLQPSLLDRLTDEEPGNLKESRDRRFFSVTQLRNAVLRDLSWLLNTTHIEETDDLDGYPQVRRSVLNYGIPSLTGRVESGTTAEAIAREMTACLEHFEPRLLRNTVKVSVLQDKATGTIDFTIEADLWAQPVPMRIFMKTELDREVNQLRIVEQPGR